MISAYFKALTQGRLQRLPFAGWYLLLNLLVVAAMIGAGFAIGASEQMIGGNLEDTQAMLRDKLSLPFIVLLAIGLSVVLFAGANICAKRIRDIGLPGWWSLLGVLLLAAALSVLASQQGSGSLGLVFLLVLLFTPSNTFGSGQ